MKKFTVFTFILTIVVIVVVADMLVNRYLPGLDFNGENAPENLTLTLPDNIDLSKTVQTNVLGAEQNVPVESSETEQPENVEETTELPVPQDSPSGLQDFEEENFVSTSKNVYIRDEQIKSAGFIGAYLEDEPGDGYLFKTIYVGDLYDLNMSKTLIRTETEMLARVYVLQAGPSSDINEVYNVLKVRGSEGLNTELNDSNDFGTASFYLNDTNRSGTAFLAVRLGGLIYGFSYPKEYHPQVKNLIQLIDWELGG